MKNIIFILLFVISANIYSQIDAPKDSLPSLNKKSLKFNNENLDNYLNLEHSDSKISNAALSIESLDANKLKALDINIPPLDIYVGPSTESNTFTRYPFANDYAFYGDMSISDNSWLNTSSTRNTYPALGGINSVNVRFNYQPLDWLTISAGPYGAKYQIMGRHYNDMGANGALKFKLHDRIRLNGYGQYSAYGKSNGVEGPMMGMFPQTYYAGTIEVKITQKFGIEGGMIRELNPFNGKWVNRPYIAPVFYSK